MIETTISRATPEATPAPRSMADAPLPSYESHSSISTYRACPLRYGFRYVERRPGEVSPAQFAFGSAVHKAFEAFGLARIRARAGGTFEPGPETLQAALDRKLATSGLTDAEIEEAVTSSTALTWRAPGTRLGLANGHSGMWSRTVLSTDTRHVAEKTARPRRTMKLSTISTRAISLETHCTRNLRRAERGGDRASLDADAGRASPGPHTPGLSHRDCSRITRSTR